MNPRRKLEQSADKVLRRFGIRLKRDRAMRDPIRLFVLKANELGAATILDVGANKGQFASEVFREGWMGDLVSFEPVTETHGRLTQSASANPHWFVSSPMALGATAGTAEINVAGNLVSSSLLEVAAASTNRNAGTRRVRTETVAVRRLDDTIEPSWAAPFALKVDAEGFDLEVLKGATNTMRNTKVIMVEMCLAPLHEGGARFGDLAKFIEDAGFRCVSLTENGFADYEQNEVLAVDGVFVKNEG